MKVLQEESSAAAQEEIAMLATAPQDIQPMAGDSTQGSGSPNTARNKPKRTQFKPLIPNALEKSLASLTEAQRQDALLAHQMQSNPQNNIEEMEMALAVSQSKDPFAEIKEEPSGSVTLSMPKSPPAPEAIAVPKGYAPSFTVENILARANVVQGNQVELVETVSGPENTVYQWKTNDVFGSSEQKPLSSEGQFETYVQAYLEKTQARCQGDFAIVPDNTMQHGGRRIDSYEVACVGPAVSSSASLLFFSEGDTFTVVAHETSTDQMATAMSIRDRVLQSITTDS